MAGSSSSKTPAKAIRPSAPPPIVPTFGVAVESSTAIDPRDSQSTSLEALSAHTRGLILETIHHAGAGHVGGPLSATDLLVHLYFRTLNIDPARPDWPERYRFILSKGHSSLAVYTVLALRGYCPDAEQRPFDAIDPRLQGPPHMPRLPGLALS